MLLETGRQLLIANGYSEQLNVKLTDVLKAHELTTGAGYNIWDNQDAFQHDLALYVASEYSWASVEGLVSNLPKVSYEELNRIVCIRYFNGFVAKDEFYIALRHWGVKKPSAQLRRAIRKGYKVTHDNLSAFLEQALVLLQRQVKPGFDFDIHVASITAALEGFAFRHRFAPPSERAKLPDAFADAFLAFLDYYTEPIPDDAS